MMSGAPGEEAKLVYEDIREQIEELIRQGELRVGDKLPPERKLAETFKVSRNSVREAIRALAEKSIVRSRRGDGTYICAPDELSVADSLTQALRTRRKRFTDVFAFRKLLEPQIAFLAAQHITRKEIDQLKILVFDQEKRLLTGEDDADLDITFHLLLAKATGNRVLLEVVKTLGHILSETRSDSLKSEERRKASVRTHIVIIDALERGDAEGAQEAMHLHLSEIERTVLGVEPGKEGPEAVEEGSES